MPKRARDDKWRFHLVVSRYDDRWCDEEANGKSVWENFCNALCGSDTYDVLCVPEKLCNNAHVHIQGVTDRHQEEIRMIKKEYNKKHYLVKMGKMKNVMRQCTKEPDDKGYQYMSKEGNPPLFSRGFTEDQLAELKAASDEYIEEIKYGMRDVIMAKMYDNDPEKAYDAMLDDAIQWCLENDKQMQMGIKWRLLNIMLRHPQSTPAWKAYFKQAVRGR